MQGGESEHKYVRGMVHMVDYAIIYISASLLSRALLPALEFHRQEAKPPRDRGKLLQNVFLIVPKSHPALSFEFDL